MRIAFVYTKGRPKSFAKRYFELADFGGSEGSAIRFALTLVKLGHTVTMHTPEAEGCNYEGVNWYPSERKVYTLNQDVVIALRFPEALEEVTAPVRALYCCDPEIPELPEAIEDGWVNVVITISKYQKEIFRKHYDIPEYLFLDSNAGVYVDDYVLPNVSKVRGRCIYCSVQDRGLSDLVGIWPLIRKDIPWATLHVTGSMALWGIDTGGKVSPIVHELSVMPGITHCGLLSREELIREQMESVLMLLPGNITSPEMCCMAAMECAAARNALIVTDIAALPERVIPGKTGSVIYRNGDWQRVFAETAVQMLRDPNLAVTQVRAQLAEREHDYYVLAQQWENRFEEMLDGNF